MGSILGLYSPPSREDGSGSDGTTPRALDPAEKQPQDFTHSAVVQQLLFGSDATEGEDTELQCGRKIKRKKRCSVPDKLFFTNTDEPR